MSHYLAKEGSLKGIPLAKSWTTSLLACKSNVSLSTPVTLDSTSLLTMAPWRRQFVQTAINQNKALQNTAIYWEEEVWSYPTYAIQTSKEHTQYICRINISICPLGMMKEHISP